MWRSGTLVAAVVAVALASPSRPHAATAADQVEAEFRAAMDAWRFNAHWRLWDMGSGASRSALPRQDFVDRMRRGNTEPDVGGDLQVIEVRVGASTPALVRARFPLRHLRRAWSEVVERPFLLVLEDGRWCVNLWDFVGLASFFPPEFLPKRPHHSPRGQS